MNYTEKRIMKNFIKLLVIIFLNINSLHAQGCWKQIYGGIGTTMAIAEDDTLWAWGWNIHGQLGNGTIINVLIPTQVSTETDWSEISILHGNHAIAIKTDGTLWGWGANYYGQVGSTSNNNSSNYILNPIQIGNDSDWAKIATGRNNSFAIKKDGSLWASGINTSGQLGIGNNSHTDVFTQVGKETDWFKVAPGSNHTLALKSDGTIWTWGSNHNGQLGTGNNIDQNTPIQVGSLDSWTDIFSGLNFNIVKKFDNSLWSFGENVNGQLGIGNNLDINTPTQIGNSMDWQDVAAGSFHVLAIKNNGTLWDWGFIPNGDGVTYSQNNPEQIGVSNDWQEIKTGDYNFMATNANNEFYLWGSNNYGQLGNGESGNWRDIFIPTLLDCPIPNIEENYTDLYTIYPNPTYGNLYFTSNLEYQYCFSVDGKYINLNKNENHVDVSPLSQGVYLFYFKKDNGEIFHIKIIKR